MIITENYLRSKFCLCEMGACWAMSHNGIPLLVEPIGFEDLDGVVTAKQAIKMSDALAMSGLKDTICKLLNLDARSATWEKKRDAFIDAIPRVPETQRIVVSSSEPISEVSHESSIADRLGRLIVWLENEMSKLTVNSSTADINRLFAMAYKRLEGIHADSISLGVELGQLEIAMAQVKRTATPRIPTRSDHAKEEAELAIKMLNEQYTYLLSG